MTQMKKARVLIDTNILGVPVKCGWVVNAATETISHLVKQGVLDDKKTAVEQGLKDGQEIKEILEQAESEKQPEPAKDQTPQQPDTGGAN